MKTTHNKVNDIITESQNHRMVGVGRNLCGSSSPALLPKQGHVQQAEPRSPGEETLISRHLAFFPH